MKVLAIIICIILALTMVTGAVSILSSGFTNLEVSTWMDRFAASDEPVVTEDPIVEEPIDEDPVIEDPIVEDPIVEDPIVEDPVLLYYRSISSEYGTFLNFEDYSGDPSNDNLLDSPINPWTEVPNNNHAELGNRCYAVLVNFLELLEEGSSYELVVESYGVQYTYVLSYISSIPFQFGNWVYDEGVTNIDCPLGIHYSLSIGFSFPIYPNMDQRASIYITESELFPGVLLVNLRSQSFPASIYSQISLISITKVL